MGQRVGVEQRGREEMSHTFSGSLGKCMSNHHAHPSPPFTSLTSLRTLMGEFQRDTTQPVKETESLLLSNDAFHREPALLRHLFNKADRA